MARCVITSPHKKTILHVPVNACLDEQHQTPALRDGIIERPEVQRSLLRWMLADG